MTNETLIAKIQELRELQRLIEEATEEVEAIKDTIKAEMGALEELRAGEYKVIYKCVVSARLDSKALKAAQPAIYQRFCKEVVTRPLKVS